MFKNEEKFFKFPIFYLLSIIHYLFLKEWKKKDLNLLCCPEGSCSTGVVTLEEAGETVETEEAVEVDTAVAVAAAVVLVLVLVS